MKVLVCIFLLLLIGQVQAEEHNNGFVKAGAGGSYLAWSASKKEWVSMKVFWHDFAKTNDAKYWGKSEVYPTYSDVEEFDTFLVQVGKGHCLMQFFHSRWRRANDVQRWHDAFNEYSGCPYVFD